MPGMYGQVSLDVQQPAPSLLIPSSALVADASGLRVLIVRDEKIVSSPVVVGRDLGTQLEIEKGLSADDQVVTNPTANLLDGMSVRIGKPRQQ
jgi:multidrug efflux pump subunit AcrA (membrane-fusion protein)